MTWFENEMTWFENEIKKLKKKHPFFFWYYPKWLAITEWYYGWKKK